MTLLILLSALVNLLHFPCAGLLGRLAKALPSLTPGEVAYLGWIVAALLTGISLLVLVLAVVWLEHPSGFRQFFKLGPVDWPSIGLILFLTATLNALEFVFLRRVLFEPVRLFLISAGLWGRPSLEAGFTPDPNLAGLNTLLLLLVIWIEAPEEIFFRGYVQNHLQARLGPNGALLVGAVIWDAWHLFAPAEFVRRLFYGLAYSLVFRLRQNTTALAIVHPLGNRLLVLPQVLPML